LAGSPGGWPFWRLPDSAEGFVADNSFLFHAFERGTAPPHPRAAWLFF